MHQKYPSYYQLPSEKEMMRQLLENSKNYEPYTLEKEAALRKRLEEIRGEVRANGIGNEKPGRYHFGVYLGTLPIRFIIGLERNEYQTIMNGNTVKEIFNFWRKRR